MLSKYFNRRGGVTLTKRGRVFREKRSRRKRKGRRGVVKGVLADRENEPMCVTKQCFSWGEKKDCKKKKHGEGGPFGKESKGKVNFVDDGEDKGNWKGVKMFTGRVHIEKKKAVTALGPISCKYAHRGSYPGGVDPRNAPRVGTTKKGGKSRATHVVRRGVSSGTGKAL